MSFHVQVVCLAQNFVWSTWYSVLQVPLGQMWWESHHVFVVARHCRDVHLWCMKWPRHCHKIVIAVARLAPPFCVYVYFLRPKISDIFYFQTSCFTVRLIEVFYWPYFSYFYWRYYQLLVRKSTKNHQILLVPPKNRYSKYLYYRFTNFSEIAN